MIHAARDIIRNIKILINITLITGLFIQLIYKAIYTLPGDWLFFMTSDAMENLISAAIAYVLYYHVFKSRSRWQKVAYVLLFGVTLAGLALLKDLRIHNYNSGDQVFEYFTNFLGQTLLFYAVLYLIDELPGITRYKKLKRDLNEAREQLLRNQMHPHFLFNAFNALYSLCLKNSTEASDYVLKLSSMMRYLTDESQLKRVPLKKEIDFIKKYLDIEKLRFGNDASIQLSVPGDLISDKLIEPFLLMALVENAFKHGFYTNSKHAFVHIVLNLENNELVFCVENSVFEKQHFQEDGRKGKGLGNLRQRLQLLYPGNSSFEITSTKNKYTALLKITLN